MRFWTAPDDEPDIPIEQLYPPGTTIHRSPDYGLQPGDIIQPVSHPRDSLGETPKPPQNLGRTLGSSPEPRPAL